MKSLIYFIAKSRLMNKLVSLSYLFTFSDIKKSKNKARYPFIIVLTVFYTSVLMTSLATALPAVCKSVYICSDVKYELWPT